MAVTWKKIAYEDNVITKALFDAHTVLYATTDDTPVALSVTEQTLVGRLTGGNISAVAIGIADNTILQVDHASPADDDYAKFTAAGIEGRSYAEVRTDINVADGADVTGSNAPQAHAASHKNSGSDEILLNEFGEPTGAVAINGQQITDVVIHTVANAAGRPTAVVGKVVWQTDELALYACTVSV